MAKIKIPFNGVDYSVDESALSVASDALRTHLSTVMNGTGATIELGGVSFNIDSTKLSTATNNFISHLGTIAGSGSKVKVGGVEYSVDSSKVATAVTELETVLSGLGEERLGGDGAEYYTLAPTALSFRSTAPLSEFKEVQVNGEVVSPSNYTLEEGSTIIKFSIEYLKTLGSGDYEVAIVSKSKTTRGGFTVKSPNVNEHSFYYNQPYAAYVPTFGGTTIFFMREGGTMDVFVAETFYTEECSYIMNGNAITVCAAAGTFTGTFADDGMSVYVNELFDSFVLGGETVVADEDYIYMLNDDQYYVLTVINKTKSSYGTIRTGINDKPTTAIYMSAFANCENLTTITIPVCIETVYQYAFVGCVSLDEVIFENCRVSQWGEIFSDDAPLTKGVTIKHSYLNNDYVCDICGHCEHLHTEMVGKTDEYSGDVICLDCNKTVTKGNYTVGLFDANGNIVAPWSTLVNDYGMDVTANYTSSTYKTDTASPYYVLTNNSELSSGVKLVIGGNVTTIGDYAFTGCKSLTSIEIPEGVTTISQYAFNETSLTSIVIPASVTTINSRAFCYCASLESVTFAEGSQLETIGTYVFEHCKSLTSIEIPEGVTTINNGVFVACTSLKNIVISANVTAIRERAFSACILLESIVFGGTTEQWDTIEFYKNGGYFDWNYDTGNYTITCTDGTIAKDGTVTMN